MEPQQTEGYILSEVYSSIYMFGLSHAEMRVTRPTFVSCLLAATELALFGSILYWNLSLCFQ